MPRPIERSPFERGAVGATVPADSNAISNAKDKGWIDTFLSAIMQGASVTDATRQAGVHITLPYKTRNTDEAFKRAWREAAEVGTELMEQEAARRAYHGTLKPVYHKGVECGQVREYSDTLMIFLLKARKPEVYREGVDDEARRGNMVVNINVVQVEKQPQLIEVSGIGDGSEQDAPGVPEAARLP